MSEIGEAAQSNAPIASTGPWPFITRRTYVLPDRSHVIWRSRDHRKGLRRIKVHSLVAIGGHLLRALWMPRRLNWWIASIFAFGASLFILGSLLILVPAIGQRWGLQENAVNAVFFAGSIPFTTAAYLQLFQAANVKEFLPQGSTTPRRAAVFGWRPDNIGWLSCALQFPGTVLFNFNTFDAMLPGLSWVEQDLEIWIPNFIGSILFLASGYLAFIETCHAHFAWKPAHISWWVTFSNLFGCVGFMISAVFAFVPPEPLPFDAVTISVFFTLLGAGGFLMGSLLMLPETARPEKT